MTSKNEQIEKLKKQLQEKEQKAKAEKAEILKKIKQIQAKNSKAERAKDTRRKIIAGAYFLKNKNNANYDDFVNQLSDKDRELFVS